MAPVEICGGLGKQQTQNRRFGVNQECQLGQFACKFGNAKVQLSRMFLMHVALIFLLPLLSAKGQCP